MNVIGLAAQHSFSSVRPFAIERREPGARDVVIEIEYCGVCHSDVHQVKNEWHNTVYPCMPGHEIVGRVVRVGAAVDRFAVGQRVGVGCMVDSCGQCAPCKRRDEQYCVNGFLATYNGNSRKPTKENNTFGGYSSHIVVRDTFVLKLPDGLSPAEAAPILCAGVTTYSPMKHWKVGPGTRVGIVGFGGLGQMAVKIALALGADVKVITQHEEKASDARKLGASDVIVSKNDDQMKKYESSFDFLLSTVPTTHDINPYTSLVALDGVCVVVGCLLPLLLPLDMSRMIMDRKSIGSSLIGSIAETQEVLDFCAKHGIVSTIKLIGVDEVNDAFSSIDKGEPDFRYVIDMATIRGKQVDTSIAAKLGM